jgi:hypothetical protein
MTDTQKRKPIRSKAITQAANGESCTWPGCGKQDGTVVFAHSNMSIHGKATARKADDLFGAFLCSEHHTEYDQWNRRDDLVTQGEWHFMRAMSETQRRLFASGIITIKGMK